MATKNITVKAPNYTAEQTADLVNAYSEAPTRETVSMLAEKMGRSTASIIAKLTREGVYKKAERLTKTGEPVEKKDETADAIGAVLRMTEGEITSLTKANKTALKKIWGALASSRPLTPEDDKTE